jgi:hypothetical protein
MYIYKSFCFVLYMTSLLWSDARGCRNSLLWSLHFSQFPQQHVGEILLVCINKHSLIFLVFHNNISFTVPARYVDYGQLPLGAPHPMVAIATVGSTSPIRLIRERTIVENCLQQFQNNVGCFVPDLSYFKWRQLEVGEGNVIETTERLCRAQWVVV